LTSFLLWRQRLAGELFQQQAFVLNGLRDV
jgi:hypothetical protein